MKNTRKEKGKMMRRKRTYVFMLAMTVAALSLNGCGGGGPKTEGTEHGTKDREFTSEPTESQDSEPDSSFSADGTQETEPTETQNDIVQIPEIHTEDELITYGGIVQVGDAAYELYTYLDDVAENYAAAVNKTAENLSGQAQVYDLVIPLGSGITFPDNLKGQINSSDQKSATQKIQAKLSEEVSFLGLYDILMEHRNEYVYFRTDHHWTALGAYYAYTEFCRAKGIAPESVDSYATKEFDGFLGSFYNDTNKNEKLASNPDVVTAYLPNMSAICHVEDSKGVKYDSPVIYDETKAPAAIKYSTFIAGDNPFTEIVNKELEDGSSCIVVKESFGNAFVPFLVDHYQTIYVIDYRYWTGSISEFAGEKGVDDVIFINNLSMIRSKSLVGKLHRVI